MSQTIQLLTSFSDLKACRGHEAVSASRCIAYLHSNSADSSMSKISRWFHAKRDAAAHQSDQIQNWQRSNYASGCRGVGKHTVSSAIERTIVAVVCAAASLALVHLAHDAHLLVHAAPVAALQVALVRLEPQICVLVSHFTGPQQYIRMVPTMHLIQRNGQL
jgi:hypothetical protein